MYHFRSIPLDLAENVLMRILRKEPGTYGLGHHLST
jgi:hypothetical protein